MGLFVAGRCKRGMQMRIEFSGRQRHTHQRTTMATVEDLIAHPKINLNHMN